MSVSESRIISEVEIKTRASLPVNPIVPSSSALSSLARSASSSAFDFSIKFMGSDHQETTLATDEVLKRIRNAFTKSKDAPKFKTEIDSITSVLEEYRIARFTVSEESRLAKDQNKSDISVSPRTPSKASLTPQENLTKIQSVMQNTVLNLFSIARTDFSQLSREQIVHGLNNLKDNTHRTILKAWYSQQFSDIPDPGRTFDPTLCIAICHLLVDDEIQKKIKWQFLIFAYGLANATLGKEDKPCETGLTKLQKLMTTEPFTTYTLSKQVELVYRAIWKDSTWKEATAVTFPEGHIKQLTGKSMMILARMHLKILGLARNELETLPPSLDKLRQLKHFVIEGNPLQYLAYRVLHSRLPKDVMLSMDSFKQKSQFSKLDRSESESLSKEKNEQADDSPSQAKRRLTPLTIPQKN